MILFNQIFQKAIYNLEHKLPSHFTYHNSCHTQYVLKQCIYIAEKEGISDHELMLLKTAALYHDIGFIINRENHESISCEMASQDLKEMGFEAVEIDMIHGMIMATHIPQSPKTLLEKILADADLEYLGTDNFLSFGQKLYEELRYFQPNLTDKQWHDIQIEFISNHSYHTDYCRKHKEPIKKRNLENIMQKYQLLR